MHRTNDKGNKPTDTAVFTRFCEIPRGASFCVMYQSLGGGCRRHMRMHRAISSTTVRSDGNERIGDSAILGQAGIARGRAD